MIAIQVFFYIYTAGHRHNMDLIHTANAWMWWDIAKQECHHAVT